MSIIFYNLKNEIFKNMIDSDVMIVAGWLDSTLEMSYFVKFV